METTQDEIKNLKAELEQIREIPRVSNSLAKAASNLLSVNDVMQLGAHLLLLQNALHEYDRKIEQFSNKIN